MAIQRQIKTAEDLERWLTTEIKTFEGTVAFARRRGLGRVGTYSSGVADAYRVARAILRTTILPDCVQPGDVLTTVIATAETPNPLKDLLIRKL
jgi:hypothetical protein